MKKIIFALISICIVLMISCQKQEGTTNTKSSEAELLFSQDDFTDPDIIRNHLDEYHAALESRAPAWWKKFKKWVKAHSGTHLFPNCQGNHPCGPCAGICLSTENIPVMVAEDYELTSQDSINVYGLFILHEYENTLMVLSFIDSVDFVHLGYFYLQDDWDLGEAVADSFDQPQIIIQSGVYPVVTDYHSQGETVVDIDN